MLPGMPAMLFSAAAAAAAAVGVVPLLGVRLLLLPMTGSSCPLPVTDAQPHAAPAADGGADVAGAAVDTVKLGSSDSSGGAEVADAALW